MGGELNMDKNENPIMVPLESVLVVIPKNVSEEGRRRIREALKRLSLDVVFCDSEVCFGLSECIDNLRTD